MTFEEAKDLHLIDTDFISIKTAKLQGLIPKDYTDCITDTCLACNSDLATNLNLTKIICVDPACKLKMAGRAMKVLNNFGIKGIGRAYCTEYFSLNPQFKSHLAILYGKRVNYYKTNRLADSDKLMQNLYNIRITPINFADLVSRLAFTDLGSRARIIFKGFNSYSEFEEFLSDNNLTLEEYLTSLEGIDYILANKLSRTLTIFRQDLLNITKYFFIKPASYATFKICLTGDMDYKNMTKKEFETYLNILGEGYLDVEASNAKMTADFIVSKYANEYVKNADGSVMLDTNSNPVIVDYTAKHNIGKMRNITENRKVLLSPEDMVNVVSRFVSFVKKGKVLKSEQ